MPRRFKGHKNVPQGRRANLAERCKPGRKVQTWQKGANLAEGCKPGRRVQTWQKGANLAEGCKPGRRVQTWQKGANLAEGCRRCKKWISPLHPCTFDTGPLNADRPASHSRFA